MKRRKFIENISKFGAGAFILNNIPFKTWAEPSHPLQRIALECDNDRVLVILQMLGGNDGVNTAVPLGQYDSYQNVRPNIALPNTGSRKLINLDPLLGDSQIVGLHPDMGGFKSLYDEGKLKLVQGVSYANNNGSHFRSRDILFMGGGANDYLTSGWAGRYLGDWISPLKYPKDFPNNQMKDPLALEFGNEEALLFHQQEDITTSININDPVSFFNLVENLDGFADKPNIDNRGIPPQALVDSPYFKELNYILALEEKTDDYDDRLLATYNEGKKNDPNVTYPAMYPFLAPKSRLGNPIANEFKVIANLIHGGCKTKIYLVKIGGFDTHAQQVESSDTSMGNHAALLYHISATIKAFQDDLKARGIEDKVLTITTSEFGRRVYSNGSRGTDHGNAAPIFIIGKKVDPGVLGVGPDMNKDNVNLQYDYRQIYSSILKQWFCVDAGKVDNTDGLVFRGEYNGRGQDLSIIASPNAVNDFLLERFKLNNCYPNPARDSTTINFYLNTDSFVEIVLINNQGIKVKTVFNGYKSYGEHHEIVDLKDFKTGVYFYKITAGKLTDTKKLVVI